MNRSGNVGQLASEVMDRQSCPYSTSGPWLHTMLRSAETLHNVMNETVADSNNVLPGEITRIIVHDVISKSGGRGAILSSIKRNPTYNPVRS